MGKEAVLMKEVWVPADKPFLFREAKDIATGKQTFILSGLLLPFGQISRNNVLYDKESIKEKHKQLIGRPVMYNHKIEGAELPRGHYVDSYCIDEPDAKHPVPGWYYKADIDPHETELIRKLQRGDLRHVSIQLVGGKVLEKIDPDTNVAYSEAHVADIIEGSIVPAPGFLDTTAQFAEALHPGHTIKEQVIEDPAIGAGPVIPDTSQGINDATSTLTGQPRTNQTETGGGTMPRKRMKEQNDEEIDTQAPAATPVDGDKGTPLVAQDVGQDDGSGMIAKENDANVDEQAAASIPPDTDKGTPLDAKAVGQDEPYEDQVAGASKMENARKGRRLREQEADAELKEQAEDELTEAEDEMKESRKRMREAKRKLREMDEEEPKSERAKKGRRYKEQEAEEELTEAEDELKEAEDEMKESRKKMREAKRRLREAEGDEPLTEEDEPMEPVYEEQDDADFKEQYEDDMGKVTDIMEKFKEEIDELKDKVEQLGDGDSAKESEEEEPQPPMTESAKLNNVFTEAIKDKKAEEKKFEQATRNVLYG